MGWLARSGLLPPTWINPAIECKSGGSTKIYIFVGFPSIFPSNKANDLTTLHPSDHPNAYLPNFHVESAIWRFDRIRVPLKSSMLPCYMICFFPLQTINFGQPSFQETSIYTYIYIWFVLYTLRYYRRWAMASGFSLARRGRAVSNGCAHARCSSWRSIACGRYWAAIDEKQGGISMDFTKCGSNKLKHPKWWDNVNN